MYETQGQIDRLTELLVRSRSGASEHLRSIIDDDRAMTAQAVLDELTGMKTIAVATVTARGEPRITALDGHFIHGRWTLSTSGASVKAAHLRARPAISAAYIDGERVAVFTHGTAVEIDDSDPQFDQIHRHWCHHYGSDPFSWGDDIRMYRLEPSWMVGYCGAAHD